MRLRSLLYTAPVAAALTVVGLTAPAAQAAPATVSPTVVATSCSTAFPPAACVAGYYEAPNALRTANGDHMTGVRERFTLTTALQAHSGGPATFAAGVQMCQHKALNAPGFKAVLFARWNPGLGTFDIFDGVNPSGSCLSGLTDVAPVLIDRVPAGHVLFLAITRDSLGVLHFTDSDETNLTGAEDTAGPFGFSFNRVGWGTEAGPNLLTTPANNFLEHSGGVFARDSDGGWVRFNRAHLTRLILVKVVGTTDGTGAGGVLMTPGNLHPSQFDMFSGQLSS